MAGRAEALFDNSISNHFSSEDEEIALSSGGGNDPGKGKGPASFDASFRKLREDLQRELFHPAHKFMRSFYLKKVLPLFFC
jgi:hypothetical protein